MKVNDKAKTALGGGDKKSGKGKHFMEGLKDWITSPGGIITLILFVGLCWYVHSQTSGKPAKG